MYIEDLQWDDNNIEHIARHNVTPQEVEDVCFGEHFCKRESISRYILSGRTESGRLLLVVIERIRKKHFRPITAFEMSENSKRIYKRWKGG